VHSAAAAAATDACTAASSCHYKCPPVAATRIPTGQRLAPASRPTTGAASAIPSRLRLPVGPVVVSAIWSLSISNYRSSAERRGWRASGGVGRCIAALHRASRSVSRSVAGTSQHCRGLHFDCSPADNDEFHPFIHPSIHFRFRKKSISLEN